MSSLAGRVEIIKLGVVLDAEPTELDYLTKLDPEAVRTLRRAVDEALHARHEARFRRIAKLATSVPAAISARVAQIALSPMLGARVAAVMEPATAIKLAGSLDVGYLADLCVSLDPLRAEPIITGTPTRLVLKVGTELIARKEYVALGRFVSVIDPDTALRVVESASGADLLQVALFAEDPAALDALVTRVDDERLTAAIDAAHEFRLYDDAVTLVASVSPESRDRLIPLIAHLEPAGRDGFVRSIHAHHAWEVAVPSLAALDDDVLAAIADTDATLDDGVFGAIDEVARSLGLGDLLERIEGLSDVPHKKAIKRALTSS